MGNSTYAIFSFPHMCSTPPGRKDPSATLGMTIREDGLSHISFHPAMRANLRPFGAPSSIGRREKVKMRIPFPPYRSLPLEGKVPRRGG